MTPAQFFSDVLDDARRASAATGVPVSTILAHWALETAFGSSRIYLEQNNPAGITRGGESKGFAAYASRAAGVDAYIKTMSHQRYAAVRSAGEGRAAATALGLSPWDAAHYGGAGEKLLRLIDQHTLTRYDTAGAGGPIPNAGGVVATPAAVGFDTGAVRGLVLKALLVAGGVGLVVAGGWQVVGPTVKSTAGAVAGAVPHPAAQAAKKAAS